jgi:hypothetical protein
MSIYWLDVSRWKDFSFNNMESWVPTYGNWCGPGWGGGERTPKPDWRVKPDENTQIDPACREHDWRYHNAAGQPDEQGLKLLADLQLLQDIRNMNFDTMSDTEKGYAIDMATAFMIKLAAYDIFMTFGESVVNIKDKAKELFNDILGKIPGAIFMPKDPDEDPLYPHRDKFPDAREEISPVILDLDGDGVETIASGDGAYFDHDGNGFAEQTGWAASDDGILVMDRNNDGIINDGRELFGSETILSNGQRASNGFEALSELDDNHDGKIDASDAAFANLKVWQDIDGDGYSTSDELKSLSELGIESINTGYATTEQTDGSDLMEIYAV